MHEKDQLVFYTKGLVYRISGWLWNLSKLIRKCVTIFLKPFVNYKKCFFSNLPFFAFKVIVTNIHQKFTDCSSNPPIFSFTNNLEHFVNDPWLFLLSIYYSTTQMNFIQPPLFKFLRLAQNLGHISIVPENLIHLQ